PGELDPYGVGEAERRVVERPERVHERRPERAIHLDDVQVRDARGEVLRQDPQSSADLEHDVRGVELRRAADHVQDVVVDQEVLTELAVRPNAELAQPAQARLTRFGASSRVLTHQPKTRAALRSTVASSSPYATPRSSAT